MKNSEVLQEINNWIVEEHGRPVKLTSMFTDAQLDSLAIVCFFCNLEDKFPISEPEDFDIKTLTVRDLVHACRLSINSED
jgi:acyl carrier protein